MRKDQALQQIRKVVREPYSLVAHWKEEKKLKVAGYYPMDFPEELYYASGFVPLAIFGSGGSITRADEYLQGFSDSLARGLLHQCLSGDLDFLDVLVITHLDDTTRVLSSICKRNLPVSYYQDFLPPKRWDTVLARRFLIEELKRLKRDLEAFCQFEITEEALNASFKIYNKDRSLLREINRLRLVYPSLLSNRDFFDTVRASMVMPKEGHVHLMEQLVKTLKDEVADGKGKGVNNSPIPILLTGLGCESPQVYDLIDETNALVVADDLVVGSRYFENDIPLGTDPIQRMADRLLSQPPSPYFISQKTREEFLWNRLQAHKAKGIVFLQLKQCETFNYDYPNLRDFFEKKGIPIALIETDLPMSSLGQIRTRLEAFFEIIGGI